MKKAKIILFIIIFLLCIIILSIIADQNKNIKKEFITIKEMSESTQVSDLNNQITTLNKSHDEYAKNVQNYKTKIAEAITNQGVKTSADEKAEVMAENIGKILQAKTTATATEVQIIAGQTAWVNGSKITGTMVNRGTLNWNPTTSTTYNVPEGYYSGGTLNSSGAYNTGFNNGVTAADNRANTSSINYQTGYNAGYNAGKSNLNNYHFEYEINDYNMNNWVTMETIKYDGTCLVTIKFVPKNNTNGICDYVNCRLVDSSRKFGIYYIF